MATSRTPLAESPLERALSRTAGVYDPDAEDDTPESVDEGEETLGGHPAQETEIGDEGEDEDDDTLDDENTDEDESTPPSPSPPSPTPPPEARQQHADRRVQLAAEEAAALKRERDDLQAKHDKLEAEIAALKAKVESPQAATKPKREIAQAKAQLQTKLQDLAKIEASDPAYWTALTDTWHDAFEPIIEAVAERVFGELTQGQIETLKERLKDEIIGTVKTDVLPAARAEQDEQAVKDRVFNMVVATAKGAGFDVSPDRGQSEEADEFWDVAVPYVDRRFPEATMEEKAQKAVEFFQKYRGITPTAPPAPQPPRPPRRQPMGRQGSGAPVTPPEDDDALLSLEDHIQRTHGKRRV